MSVEYKGKKYNSVLAITKELGHSYGAVYARLKRGYTLDEALSKASNIGKGKRKEIEYEGRIYPSINELLKSYNVPRHVYYRQLKKGATLEEVLSGKKIGESNNKEIEYEGKKYASISEFAKAYKIKPSAIYNRIKKGYPLNEVVNPERIKTKGKSIEYEGKTFISITALANEYGLNPSTVYSRLKKGFSVKETVEKEIHPQKRITKSNGLCIEWNGEKYSSISDFARKNNLNINTAYSRFRKGMSPEDVLEYKRRSTLSKPVEYNGEIYPTRIEFAEKFNIPYHKVTAGLNAGHTPEQIIETANIPFADGRRNPKQPIEFDGKLYETQKDLAEEYCVDFNTFRYKLYRGLSVEEALGLYNPDAESKKEIWLELIADDSEMGQNEGYELLKDLGLDKNTNSAEFADVEDFERQKWMYIK